MPAISLPTEQVAVLHCVQILRLPYVLRSDPLPGSTLDERIAIVEVLQFERLEERVQFEFDRIRPLVLVDQNRFKDELLVAADRVFKHAESLVNQHDVHFAVAQHLSFDVAMRLRCAALVAVDEQVLLFDQVALRALFAIGVATGIEFLNTLMNILT